MPTTAKFWTVWELDGSKTPTRRHETFDSAITEAERLARKVRGRTFVVLEALATRTVDDMKRVELEAEPMPREGQSVEDLAGYYRHLERLDQAEDRARPACYATVKAIQDARSHMFGEPLRPSPSCPLCDPVSEDDDLPF